MRTRRYRGFCNHNTEARSAAAAFVEKREAIYAILAGVPNLSNSRKNKSLRYLDNFFRDISDEGRLERQLLGKCRP